MRPPQKILPTILTLKLMSILSVTLRIKAYRNYTKRTLTTSKYRHLKTPIGPQLRDLNNYSDAIEYGSLIKRANQYYKYYTTSPTRITLWNS